MIERIHGMTMTEDIKKNPLKIASHAEKLACLHLNTTGPSEGLNLLSTKKRAEYIIPKAEMLDTKAKSFIFQLLEEVTDGNDICHGDFHPGNILISNGKYFIIDWSGATSGPKLSDMAHTYLLLKNTPRIPGMKGSEFTILKLFGRMLSRKYLKACYNQFNFDWSELSRWMVIRAGERTVFGLPSEKEALCQFINNCMRSGLSGYHTSDWWKAL